MRCRILLSLSGAVAGLVNGLFGAGGGMVLAPMLNEKTGISETERFPTSIAIITPICVISLLFSGRWNISFWQVLPYLLGGIAGGIAAGIWGKHIPTVWLHRILGVLILWGGVRYLC